MKWHGGGPGGGQKYAVINTFNLSPDNILIHMAHQFSVTLYFFIIPYQEKKTPQIFWCQESAVALNLQSLTFLKKFYKIYWSIWWREWQENVIIGLTRPFGYDTWTIDFGWWEFYLFKMLSAKSVAVPFICEQTQCFGSEGAVNRNDTLMDRCINWAAFLNPIASGEDFSL